MVYSMRAIIYYFMLKVLWTYNTKQKLFEHEVNSYSNYGYYFITSDFATLKLIGESEKINSTQSAEITSFHDFYLYEKDEINLLNSGRIYLGDDFNQSNLSGIGNMNATAGATVVSIDFHDSYRPGQLPFGAIRKRF